MTGTCIGLVITAGWLGAAVLSWIIGSIAGSDSGRLSRGLAVVPLCSVVIVLLTIAVSRVTPKTRAAVVEPLAL
jgi:fucose permease